MKKLFLIATLSIISITSANAQKGLLLFKKNNNNAKTKAEVALQAAKAEAAAQQAAIAKARAKALFQAAKAEAEAKEAQNK